MRQRSGGYDFRRAPSAVARTSTGRWPTARSSSPIRRKLFSSSSATSSKAATSRNSSDACTKWWRPACASFACWRSLSRHGIPTFDQQVHQANQKAACPVLAAPRISLPESPSKACSRNKNLKALAAEIATKQKKARELMTHMNSILARHKKALEKSWQSVRATCLRRKLVVNTTPRRNTSAILRALELSSSLFARNAESVPTMENRFGGQFATPVCRTSLAANAWEILEALRF